MFRLRRPLRPVLPRPQQMLIQAHRLMEVERYADAAPIFERLAQSAEGHGMLQRAGNLYLQAAHARLELGQAQQAISYGRHALGCFSRAGRPARAALLLPRMLKVLRDRGYETEARALEEEAQTLLARAGLDLSSVPLGAPYRKGNLPAKCASCGGPLRSDEVEWVDAATAECPYCGTPVKAMPGTG
jgi:hypothetical protein